MRTSQISKESQTMSSIFIITCYFDRCISLYTSTQGSSFLLLYPSLHAAQCFALSSVFKHYLPHILFQIDVLLYKKQCGYMLATK